MSKIFVVDDESAIRNLCYELFTKDGHEVITLARGNEALGMIKPQKPDLVLLDINIPGEDGLSLLKKMREANPSLPVAIFSGAVDQDLEKDAYQAGAVEVILKGL